MSECVVCMIVYGEVCDVLIVLLSEILYGVSKL